MFNGRRYKFGVFIGWGRGRRIDQIDDRTKDSDVEVTFTLSKELKFHIPTTDKRSEVPGQLGTDKSQDEDPALKYVNADFGINVLFFTGIF